MGGEELGVHLALDLPRDECRYPLQRGFRRCPPGERPVADANKITVVGLKDQVGPSPDPKEIRAGRGLRLFAYLQRPMAAPEMRDRSGHSLAEDEERGDEKGYGS